MGRGLFIMTMVVCKADFIDLFAGDLEKGKINMKMESLISDNFKTKAKMDSVHIILTIEVTTKASGKIINSMGKEWSTIMTDRDVKGLGKGMRNMVIAFYTLLKERRFKHGNMDV